MRRIPSLSVSNERAPLFYRPISGFSKLVRKYNKLQTNISFSNLQLFLTLFTRTNVLCESEEPWNVKSLATQLPQNRDAFISAHGNKTFCNGNHLPLFFVHSFEWTVNATLQNGLVWCKPTKDFLFNVLVFCCPFRTGCQYDTYSTVEQSTVRMVMKILENDQLLKVLEK